MERVTVTRHVAADAASVALLLAVSPDPAEGVTLGAPRRTATGFTASIQLADVAPGAVTGAITVEPDADGSLLRLVLDTDPGTAARRAERAGGTFLSALVLQARSRSYAA